MANEPRNRNTASDMLLDELLNTRVPKEAFVNGGLTG